MQQNQGRKLARQLLPDRHYNFCNLIAVENQPSAPIPVSKVCKVRVRYRVLPVLEPSTGDLPRSLGDFAHDMLTLAVRAG